MSSASRPIVYSNPYYVAPPATEITVIDYSRPIVQVVEVPVESVEPIPTFIPTDTVPANPPPRQEDELTQAKRVSAIAYLDQSRDAFKEGRYDDALELVNKAIPDLPNDPTPHELRALILFAQQKYQEAAAAIYAVLSAGPGWSWDTMKALYPTVDVYTKQLRALEKYQAEHPREPAATFLLTYHYLVLEELPAAITLLENLIKINPQDQLAAAMLTALKNPPKQNDDRPKAGGK